MDRHEIQEMLKMLVDNQELLEASMTPLAELLAAKVNALEKAGFTREEALDLIKARGLNA